jgi:hypothetical protein
MREFSLLRRRGLRRPNYAARFQFIASQHMSRDTPLMSAVDGLDLADVDRDRAGGAVLEIRRAGK